MDCYKCITCVTPTQTKMWNVFSSLQVPWGLFPTSYPAPHSCPCFGVSSQGFVLLTLALYLNEAIDYELLLSGFFCLLSVYTSSVRSIRDAAGIGSVAPFIAM